MTIQPSLWKWSDSNEHMMLRHDSQKKVVNVFGKKQIQSWQSTWKEKGNGVEIQETKYI